MRAVTLTDYEREVLLEIIDYAMEMEFSFGYDEDEPEHKELMETLDKLTIALGEPVK